MILKGGRPEDLDRVRDSLKAHRISVLREMEFTQPDGLTTLALSMQPRRLHDLLLELAAKGVGGELMGYEADEHKPLGQSG